ncbi:MAG: hypothetical protein A2176_00870 [Spirochaetes bacterium RBG_13_51_14]|nr:MAG: hypothetical protein A2176_00870 [Spirochaetes bacterium RBG_13_51_14]
MKQVVDARGLACPQPVINARRALEAHSDIVAIVDNQTAVENLRRMAKSLGCSVSEEKKSDGIYLHLEKTGSGPMPSAAGNPEPVYSCAEPGTRVLAISQDVMGNGDDELGRILIKSFFHTLAETPPVPDAIIFFNSGVKLVVEGSEIIDDIKNLELKGAKILACGTCLDYFKMKDKLKAGAVSNMYDIKELMLGAGSTITI